MCNRVLLCCTVICTFQVFQQYLHINKKHIWSENVLRSWNLCTCSRCMMPIDHRHQCCGSPHYCPLPSLVFIIDNKRKVTLLLSKTPSSTPEIINIIIIINNKIHWNFGIKSLKKSKLWIAFQRLQITTNYKSVIWITSSKYKWKITKKNTGFVQL